MSLRVEVDQLRARVLTVGGESMEALLFVHRLDGALAAPERVRRRLNDPKTAFLPCEANDESRLLQVDRVAYVAFEDGVSDGALDGEAGASRTDLTLDLVTGKTLRGTLIYHGKPGDRASDFLNSGADRFLLVLTDLGVAYVNLRAIEQIRF